MPTLCMVLMRCAISRCMDIATHAMYFPGIPRYGVFLGFWRFWRCYYSVSGLVVVYVCLDVFLEWYMYFLRANCCVISCCTWCVMKLSGLRLTIDRAPSPALVSMAVRRCPPHQRVFPRWIFCSAFFVFRGSRRCVVGNFRGFSIYYVSLFAMFVLLPPIPLVLVELCRRMEDFGCSAAGALVLVVQGVAFSPMGSPIPYFERLGKYHDWQSMCT